MLTSLAEHYNFDIDQPWEKALAHSTSKKFCLAAMTKKYPSTMSMTGYGIPPPA
jgi:hypothetical protein